MPTPPPWWIDTHVAPPAVLSSALSSGQSETASLPSFIASVSRFGLATEPVSRWSRPITIGAFSSPASTIVVEREAGAVRARPGPASRCARAGPGTRCARRAMSSQRCRCASSREELLHLRVGLADVLGIARQRDPAERPLALAEERPDVRGHEAGEVERVRDAFVLRDLADVVAVVDGRARPAPGSRASPARASRSSIAAAVAHRACCAGSACAALPLLDASSRRAGSR